MQFLPTTWAECCQGAENESVRGGEMGPERGESYPARAEQGGEHLSGLRVVAVDSQTGEAKAIVNETSEK